MSKPPHNDIHLSRALNAAGHFTGTSKTPLNKVDLSRALNEIHLHKIYNVLRLQGQTCRFLSAGLDLVDVSLSRALISRHKESVDLGVLSQPGRHLTKFFAQARDSLVVHVGLCNEFGHGD